MNFSIAIPTHKRVKILENKTLKLLKKHNIDFKKVYVFATPESYEDYIELKNKYGFNLLEGGKILDVRNKIINNFDNGERVVEMDDDIDDILKTKKGVKNESIIDLIKLFNESFEMLKGSGLFGFNSTANNYFADGKDKYGLHSIICCFGYINDKRVKLTLNEKEDFERVLIFNDLGLNILKRCGYGIKTKYWKTKGGIQDLYGFEDRIKKQNESAKILLDKYKTIIFKRVRKNGLIDLRFRYRK